LGFFNVGTDGVCQPQVYITATSFPLSSITEATNTSSSIFTCLGVQNNMTAQFVRTQRVLLDYFIDGATEQPPSTATAYTVVLGPVGGTTTVTNPGTGIVAPNRVVVGANVVPNEIRSWIALNRAQLPEAPFTMIVTTSVVGLTSAGDQIISNVADLQVEVTPDVVVTPTEGDPTEGL